MFDTRDPWPEQEQAREESRALGGDKWRYPVHLSSLFFIFWGDSPFFRFNFKMSGGILSTSLLTFAHSCIRFTIISLQLRWSKDVRSRENAARSRSKVASNTLPPQAAVNNLPPQVAVNNLPPQVAANQQLPPSQVVQLPSWVASNQPASIFEENVQEFSSSPTTEEVRKPKRRIAYGWILYHSVI